VSAKIGLLKKYTRKKREKSEGETGGRRREKTTRRVL
jgi:hypothetical protein